MKRSVIVPVAAAIGVGLLTAGAVSQEPMFGGPDDTGYAGQLWAELEKAKLVGAGMIGTKLYTGTEPHGFVLEVLYTDITVGGHTGVAVVKRNYGPEGVLVDEVSNDPVAHLGAYTVMFKREAGYDADNNDWFWVQYNPDGGLDKTPDGMALAGRVAKGMDEGCISCHTFAAGGDYLFFTNGMK